MHILVINPYLVGEYSFGGAKRTFRMIKYFARFEKVSLACFDENFQAGSYIWKSEVFDFCRHVLTVPMPKTNVFCKGVNFLFRPLPASVCFYKNIELKKNIQDYIKNSEVDFIHVEFFEMAPFTSEVSNLIPKTLVSQEILSAAKESGLQGIDRIKNWVQAPKIKRYEHTITEKFDRVYCITQEEQSFFKKKGVNNCNVYPHVVSTSEFSPSANNKEKVGNILFIGDFRHQPNQDALQWFLQSVFPLVKEQNLSLTFNVIGANFDDSMVKGLNVEGVQIHGEVQDIKPWYDMAELFVNPVVTGGGMRGKVLEAMSMEKAVVSTPLGVQGISIKDREEVFLAQLPQNFANAIVALIQDPQKRKEIACKARALVRKLYDEHVVFGKLLNDYRELYEEKKKL